MQLMTGARDDMSRGQNVRGAISDAVIRWRGVFLFVQVSVRWLDVVFFESGDHGAVEKTILCHDTLHNCVIVL